MAIIAEDTRLTIATRLANLNYKEKLDALQEKLNESIEKRFIGKTPDDVLTCFKAHKEFFIRCNEATLSSYNLPKSWFPEDWGNRTIYIHLKFSCEIPYGDEKVESYVGKLKDNDEIALFGSGVSQRRERTLPHGKASEVPDETNTVHTSQTSGRVSGSVSHLYGHHYG